MLPRVGNLRDSTLLESHVRAQMVKHVSGDKMSEKYNKPLLQVETEEGEKIHYHQVDKPSLTNRETVTLSTTRSHDLLYVRSYHPITLS